MKKIELNIKQRIIAVFLYTSIFVFCCAYFNNFTFNFLTDWSSEYNLLFVSGALLLIFGSYLTEPYFTKPVDIITNSAAIILALLSVEDPKEFIGYNYIFYWSATLLGLSLLIISLYQLFPKAQKLQEIFYYLIVKIGQSKVSFSIVYLATLFSYFNEKSSIEFIVFFSFWVILITQSFVEDIIIWLTKIIKFKKDKTELLWIAIGCENPFLYNIEVDFSKHNVNGLKRWMLVYLSIDNWEWAVWIIVNDKQLLNKKWASLYLFEHDRNPIKINLKSNLLITWKGTIFSKDNAVYELDLSTLDATIANLIKENHLYKNKDNFIWYVTNWSNINKIHFEVLIDITNPNYSLIREWSVVISKIYGHETLFQIIDWKTVEEELEKHSSYWYLTWIAQKLWKYNSTKKELESVRWLPNIYSPVFLNKSSRIRRNNLSIGKLPTTNYEIIIKDTNALVTHNTAILGILWIGKSCLTFELVQKILNNTEVKVICIDITNEYKRELPFYIDPAIIQEELSATSLTILKTWNRDWNIDDPNSWGNEELYKLELDKEIKAFYEGEKRVLILNPDWHNVSKAWSQFKIQHKVDFTVPEKTRLISERLFIYAKKSWESLPEAERRENKAKFLIIFEEAHSLIPEWNSTANPWDQSASNGTAKVILQGRKYWLWSMVITQRTANISKSILNQCNTIFAMRVFDDTWKQFLENYIWSDYSNTLPSLEERHAIVVWKALRLKQPVIIELNNRDSIVRS